MVDKSGQYWFELEDTDGVVGGQESRWEIHAVTDAPPSVTIERPGASAFVTPEAVVRLRAIAKDDLGVRSVTLHFHAPAAATADNGPAGEKGEAAETAEVEIPLFVAPAGRSRRHNPRRPASLGRRLAGRQPRGRLSLGFEQAWADAGQPVDVCRFGHRRGRPNGPQPRPAADRHHGPKSWPIAWHSGKS